PQPPRLLGGDQFGQRVIHLRRLLEERCARRRLLLRGLRLPQPIAHLAHPGLPKPRAAAIPAARSATLVLQVVLVRQPVLLLGCHRLPDALGVPLVQFPPLGLGLALVALFVLPEADVPHEPLRRLLPFVDELGPPGVGRRRRCLVLTPDRRELRLLLVVQVAHSVRGSKQSLGIRVAIHRRPRQPLHFALESRAPFLWQQELNFRGIAGVDRLGPPAQILIL